MPKPKLVIAQPSLPPETRELLQQDFELIYTDPNNSDTLHRDLSQAAALFPASLQVDEALLSHAPLLRIASNVGVGYNNFHLDAMRRHGVMGTNTPFVLDDAVADVIVGLMLACSRRISELDRYVKEGRWTGQEGRGLFGLEFSKKTLGIIGMGRIGQAVAHRCLLYARPIPQPQAPLLHPGSDIHGHGHVTANFGLYPGHDASYPGDRRYDRP